MTDVTDEIPGRPETASRPHEERQNPAAFEDAPVPARGERPNGRSVESPRPSGTERRERGVESASKAPDASERDTTSEEGREGSNSTAFDSPDERRADRRSGRT